MIVKTFYMNRQSKIIVLSFNYLKCEWQTMMQFALLTELTLVSEKQFAVHNIHFPSLAWLKRNKKKKNPTDLKLNLKDILHVC